MQDRIKQVFNEAMSRHQMVHLNSRAQAQRFFSGDEAFAMPSLAITPDDGNYVAIWADNAGRYLTVEFLGGTKVKLAIQLDKDTDVQAYKTHIASVAVLKTFFPTLANQ